MPFSRFRLYVSTEIDNPYFPPFIYSFVTMINFTVTFQGFQDQLLSIVLSHEVPHLGKSTFPALREYFLDAKTLEELEQKTLNLLENAQGKLRSFSDISRPLAYLCKGQNKS